MVQEKKKWIKVFVLKWTQVRDRLRQFWTKIDYYIQKNSLWRYLPLIFQGFFSHDKVTRRVTLLFFCAALATLSIFYQGAFTFYHAWKKLKLNVAAVQEQERREAEKKLAELELSRSILISLGTFLLEIKVLKTDMSDEQSESRMAELEIVLQCDSQQTFLFLKEHLTHVRSQITSVLLAQNRDFLLSEIGKQQLKETLRKRINDWLLQGKVTDVFFPNLILN